MWKGGELIHIKGNTYRYWDEHLGKMMMIQKIQKDLDF